MANNKLELTWLDKDKPIKVEPRLLIENPKLSNILSNSKPSTDEISDNLLIHGDNLIALKSLESKYAGKIKCIYIDPPYNTGSAFEHYDDNLEHSIWLSLMNSRLKILHKLLSDDGTFWIQIDYNEFAYLKVLLDEIFGRSNFITCITIKAKAPGGVGQESYLFDLCEYILVYRKSEKLSPNNVEYLKENLGENTTKVYNKILKNYGVENVIKTISGGIVGDIKLYQHDNFEVDKITNNKNNEDIYAKNFTGIFRTTNPQGGLMKRVMPEIPTDGLYSIEYVPSKGKNAGMMHRYYFYYGSLIVWLRDTAIIENNKVYKLVRNNNLWIDNLHQGIAKEGGVDFKQSKKPEKLIERILSIATNPGDLVLDSFLGSGTTAAVAHKMKRKWIGIEMGDHAYTHCKVRLDKIIDGKDQSGVTKSSNWNGGGGYKFYELAPSLIQVDSFGQSVINDRYNADMLAAAVALHEGYDYNPNQDIFWKQAKNGDFSYLFTTTRHLDRNFIDSVASQMAENEFLVISCKSFDSLVSNLHKNIAIKKIPQSLLKNCEFDKENYNLNIINPPVYEEEGDDEDE